MSSNVLAVLDADEQTEKRAQWEAFEFDVNADAGTVAVRNGSYVDSEAHEYTVQVESGIPFDCDCPAAEYRPGPCKHAVAVAIREPILKAVDATTDAPTSETRADGGIIETGDDGEVLDKDGGEERPNDCNCLPRLGATELPCWPCYRDGFETPNSAVDEEIDCVT